MKVAVLFSGGKDSTYALYWAVNQGWDVEALVSLTPERDDSYMFHKPCVELAKLQAECMGLHIVEREVSGEKEKEVVELERVLSKLDVDGVVSGAVASEYQKTRIDTVCHNLGLKSFAPLWHKKPVQLLRDILHTGFEVMVVSVSAYGLGEEWLGKLLTEGDVSRLQELEKKYGVNPCGEGGEFETLVLDGPLFGKKLVIRESRKKWGGQAGVLEVVKAEVA